MPMRPMRMKKLLRIKKGCTQECAYLFLFLAYKEEEKMKIDIEHAINMQKQDNKE